LGLRGRSRLTMQAKSSARMPSRFSRARSTASCRLRVITAMGTPASRNKATSSSAPTLGSQSSAARISASTSTASLRSRFWGSSMADRNSSNPMPFGQPTALCMAAKSITPGRVRVPSKSKTTAAMRNGLPPSVCCKRAGSLFPVRSAAGSRVRRVGISAAPSSPTESNAGPDAGPITLSRWQTRAPRQGPRAAVGVSSRRSVTSASHRRCRWWGSPSRPT
jgi:hypothetical protein